MGAIVDKTMLTGYQTLIPVDDWVPYEAMNSEEKVLNHEIFERALMSKKVAFFSACTSTRPYGFSKKWSRFIEEFSNYTELIVVSNGGLIPQDYWECFPYLNYNANSEPRFRTLYDDILKRRLNIFLGKFPFDYVMAHASPHKKVIKVYHDVLSDLKKTGRIKDYSVTPNIELYEKAQKDGFNSKKNGSGMRNPDLHKFILSTMVENLKAWGMMTRSES